MPNDAISQLDTKSVASDFNDFLASQGLGNMNPNTARRYRAGIETSPMDDILALNGFNIDEVFKKVPPEPEPLASLSNTPSDLENPNYSEASTAKAAIESLDLSEKAIQTLESLLDSGGSTAVGELPAPMMQLLSNPGINSAAELVRQIGIIYSIIKNQPLPANKDVTHLMLEWMNQLGTDSSTVLTNYLTRNPVVIKELLRDPLIGISIPLTGTSNLLKVNNPFKDDPIVGNSQDETLLASKAGGSSITGGGGKDFFVISLSSSPFPNSTLITDFNSASGSKIVLDSTDYPLKLSNPFGNASSPKTLSKVSKTNTTLIFSDRDHRLLLNGNQKKKGLGNTSGGIIAEFSNSYDLKASDILIFKDNDLFDLNGSLYSYT
jgi:hypothetical protein